MTSVDIRCNDFFSKDSKRNVEVVTVWYNRAELVDVSIKSLLTQNFDNFSILAVDDGSTDRTGELLENALHEATQFEVPMRVWRKSNDGFTITLKKAIEEISDSDVLALHGAGDRSLPDRLDTQYELLQESVDIVGTGVNVAEIDPSGERRRVRSVQSEPVSDPWSGEVPRLGTHGAAMFTRSAYESAGGYRRQFEYAQDADFLIRLREIGEFRNASEVLYHKLVSEDTVKGGNDWMKRYRQLVYSAAALESARQRAEGNPDPIDAVNGQVLKAMCEIAKSNGLHERDAERAVQEAWNRLRNRQVRAVLSFLQFGGLHSLRMLPRLPRALFRDVLP